MKGGRISLFFLLLCCASLPFVHADDPEMNSELAATIDPGSGRESAMRYDISSTASALNILFRSASSPIDCATPLILSLLNDSSPKVPLIDASLRFIVSRPSIKEENFYKSTEGNFLIHYTKDRNTIDAIPSSDNERNGIPDYVEVIGQGLEEARKMYIDSLGFHNPIARFSPGQPYDVYVLNLGGGVTGATIPLQSGKFSGSEQVPSFILIDTMILDDVSILKATAAHQFAHAITLAYSCTEEPWWAESTAIWLEDRLYHTLPRYLDSINFRLKFKALSLNGDDLKLSQGNALWAFFLGEKDVSLIRRIWEELEIFPDIPLLEGFSKVIERDGHGSLPNAFSDYAIWNYFTGSRNDGNHFLFADMLSDPAYDSSFSSYPVTVAQAENPVETLGTSFVRFESERTRGALIVTFDGDQSCQWDVDMLLVSNHAPLYFKSKMSVNASGHGVIGIPWQRVSDVVMIVKNLSCEEKSTGKYGFSAIYDPSYPFELRCFSAAEEEGSIALQWETASENNLYGWNVYRSTEPEQNFSRINEIIIPSLGDSSSPIIYKFLDGGARQAVKYYYYIEGITYEGLQSRSPVASATAKQ